MSAEPPDRIRLEGVRCRCRVGVPEAERRKPQAVELDVALELDLRPAARSDDVADSADYWAVEKRVRAAVESAEFKLLERLAEAAARAALAADSRVRAVEVRAAKRPAVMPRTGRVVVEIRRSRAT
ncbi:MAG: dihydroneopterin aldolase [Elusimicrobia bacterium]|nr:dihydroneopterin aldolase [Elusimicrobiota bacterium]